MGAVVSCIQGVFRAIGNVLMAIVNGIASICMAIIGGIASVFNIIISCLTCGKAGHRKGGHVGSGTRTGHSRTSRI
ncbi:hypothetical protein EJ08DRAFT_651966 [Tothia fuscella]|uniref:Uncharacterized protein n=1 Tax=Tothia fuscella TaxID=1048955 RepID=A0A9P4NL92_9PEZI|nr:hypothetical protein EJ08DRAFT_651966 [Tothia fuscella]